MQPASSGRLAAIKRPLIKIDVLIIILFDGCALEFVTSFVQCKRFSGQFHLPHRRLPDAFEQQNRRQTAQHQQRKYPERVHKRLGQGSVSSLGIFRPLLAGFMPRPAAGVEFGRIAM
jgi:hypothetical protein